ncbi:DUF2520 domain-containing protein [Microbacterium sp. NPDC077663]|uniref:DUF2520 domain-containing protein n=1 Tax=Microbacterium sp. NPDC077663 TaxID=3364189 RepID=UPI0037C6DBBD
MTRDGRLGVGVIGAGRVGPVVAAALAGAGHALTGITSGSDDDRVEAILPDAPRLVPEEVVRRSELVILAVPRDELPGLVAGLAEIGVWQVGQIVMHTDAAHGIQVLAPAAAKGAIPVAIHPAIAFTGTSTDLRALRDAYAAVTAPAAALPIAQALAVEMGCEPVVVADSDRAAYGEAIATATEFSSSIVRQSADLLRSAGVDDPSRYLSALVHTTIDRALTESAPSVGDAPPAVP